MAHKVQETGWMEKIHDVATTSWVLVLLFVAGIVAIVTAVLVAWPAIAYLASRFFGAGG